MGRPESDPSVYLPDDQPQTEYDLQSQEYQSEQTQEAPPAAPDEYVASTYETNYYPENQQDQYLQPQPNDPQAQLQFQQPQPQQQQQRSPPPPAAQQRQPQQYPPPSPPPQPQPQPQANMGYGAQPGQPGPQPRQNTPMYSNGLNQQPVAYPPQSPQPMHPVNYPPQVAPQAFAQANYLAPQPVQFSPQNNVQGGYMGTPSSPLKPAAQVNYNAAQGYPVHMSPMPQPQPALLQVGNNEGWKTGLFDCMDDPMNALITAFFPCLTFGQVAEIVDNGHPSCGTSGLLYGLVACLIWLPCIMSCSYRTKLRSKFGLVEDPAPDCITHFLCEYCALCQEYRELQLRGFDPSIGWQGNVMKNQSLQQQQVAMVPPVNQRMMG